MIKLTKTTDKPIWIDHRKIVSLHIEDTPNGATYVTMSDNNQDIRVFETPDDIIHLIRCWDSPAAAREVTQGVRGQKT